MSSYTFSSRLLDSAQNLLDEGRRSTAFRRRAVSTAYYAVFHALAKICADYVTRSARRSTEEYARAYRALDHGPLRNSFAQSPLKERKTLLRIGEIVVRLQAERHRADYFPPTIGLFTRNQAQELIDLAKIAVMEIEKLKPGNNDCRILAISLLFRERKS